MNKAEIIQHYHCCATCVNFSIRKSEGKTITSCIRLGFETKSSYQFDCWDPKPRVVEAIKKKLNK